MIQDQMPIRPSGLLFIPMKNILLITILTNLLHIYTVISSPYLKSSSDPDNKILDEIRLDYLLPDLL